MKKRNTQDNLLKALVYAASSLSLLVLVALLSFMLQKGWGSLSLDLFTRPYWSEPISIEYPSIYPGEFESPTDLPEGAVFSEAYGFALIDSTNPKKEAVLELVYLDPNSPLNHGTNIQAGHEGEAATVVVGYWVDKIGYMNTKGVVRSSGRIVGQNAQKTIQALDQSVSLENAYVQTKGGGIVGSLLATLYLIFVSLLLALPIGISTAIYLNEYAKRNMLTSWIRSSIELLTGVPSIVFGLMGVLVLFPITALFGAQGTSILLGGLTLSVILLPIIIRTTEESLKVVPQSFRDASLSLGANQSQTLFKIVIPSAIPGILTATLLGIGRIIGESAALIYTMGTFVSDDPKLLKGATSLAVQIWSIMSGDQPNFALASAISLVILLIVLILNFSVKLLAKRFRKVW